MQTEAKMDKSTLSILNTKLATSKRELEKEQGRPADTDHIIPEVSAYCSNFAGGSLAPLGRCAGRVGCIVLYPLN